MPCTGQSYTSYGFGVTGAPFRRTEPDRLSDIINVKDWGALGDSLTNDQTKIQAAINFAISRTINGVTLHGGTVFFPAGTYVCTPPPVVGHASINAGVIVKGAGRSVTIINSNLDAGGLAIDCLERVETITIQGKLTFTRPNASAETIVGGQIDTTAGQGCSLTDIQLGAGGNHTPDQNQRPSSTGTYGPCTYGTIGIAAGTGTTIRNLRTTNSWDITVAMGGAGISLLNSASENVNTGVRLGWAPTFTASGTTTSGSNIVTFTTIPLGLIAGRFISGTNIPASTTITSVGTVQGGPNSIQISNNATGGGTVTITFGNECPAIGCVVSGWQQEATDTCVDLYNAQGCLITGVYDEGSIGATAISGGILGGTWLAGTATLQTDVNHNLPVGTIKLQLFGTIASTGWIAGTTAGMIMATRVDANHFSYSLASYPGASSTGNWCDVAHNGLRVRVASECVVIGNRFDGRQRGWADIDLGWGIGLGGDANLAVRHRNNTMSGATGTWALPSDLRQLTGWKIAQSGPNPNNLSFTGVYSDLLTNPFGRMLFAHLPGQSGVTQEGPFEGQEYDITDSPTAATGNWNATVTVGGGTNHVKVRWDGVSNWRVSG